MQNPVSICYQKNVTNKDVKYEAKKIWKKVREYQRDSSHQLVQNLYGALICKYAEIIGTELATSTFHSACTDDQIYHVISDQFPEFARAYPIVIRFMCYFRIYNSTAFCRWLSKLSATQMPTEEQYLDLQADYVYYLYMSNGKHLQSNNLQKLRQEVRESLTEDSMKFKKVMTAAENKINDEEQKLQQKNKCELANFISTIGASGMQNANTIRVEYIAPIADIDKSDIDELLDITGLFDDI